MEGKWNERENEKEEGKEKEKEENEDKNEENKHENEEFPEREGQPECKVCIFPTVHNGLSLSISILQVFHLKCLCS